MLRRSCLITLWRQRDVFVPRELTFELTRFRRVAGSARLACTQQTHCGMHASVFSHTQTTTRAGLCPSGERSRSSTRRKYADLPIISSSFEMATDVKGLTVKDNRMMFFNTSESNYKLYIRDVGYIIKRPIIYSRFQLKCTNSPI